MPINFNKISELSNSEIFQHGKDKLVMLDPKNTVVIILGASKWPNTGLKESSAFKNSACKIKDYFCNSLGVKEENVLWLFDYAGNVCGLMDEMFSFFEKKSFASKIHLFFYYVGHGVVSIPLDDNYFVYLQSSHKNRRDSQFPITNFVNVIEGHHGQIKFEGCYIIIDACYSGSASKPLKNALNRLAENEIKVDTVLLCSSHESHISTIRKDGQSTLFTSALLDSLQSERGETWSFQDLRSEMERVIKNRYRENKHIMPYVEDPYSKGGGDSGPSYTKIFPPFPYPPQVNLEIAVLIAVKEMTKTGAATKNRIVERVNSQRGFQKEDIEKTINDLCQKRELIKNGIFFSLGNDGRDRLAFNR